MTLFLIILNWRGNLSQKSLSGVVRRENVVLDSEYLETIFIAVPRYFSHESSIDDRNEEKSFNARYETLTPNVVPRSAQKIAQDDEFSLYGVTLFSRDVAEFNHRCRELKYHLSICSGLTKDGSRATSSTQILSSVAKPKNSIKPPKPRKRYGYFDLKKRALTWEWTTTNGQVRF